MQNLFEVLGLVPTSTLSLVTLRNAYRQALLRHHPDKHETTTGVIKHSNTVSIDEITLAYKTLSDTTERHKHLRELRLQSLGTRLNEQTQSSLNNGLDVVDLDDFYYDETNGVWIRECRCGSQPAFCLTENDLEREAEHGEITIGCRGCSLWLKVLFQTTTDGS